MDTATVYLTNKRPPPPVIILDRPGSAQVSMIGDSVNQSAFMMGMDEQTGDFHVVLRVESLNRLQEFSRALQAELDAHVAAGARQDVPVALHLSRSLLSGPGAGAA